MDGARQPRGRKGKTTFCIALITAGIGLLVSAGVLFLTPSQGISQLLLVFIWLGLCLVAAGAVWYLSLRVDQENFPRDA